MSSDAAQRSKLRNFLFWALLVVWFGEMTLWGVRPLSEMWTRVWQIALPADPGLATALYLTHAFEAAAKGALGVMAVYALRSSSPLARSGLFASMALVPPLNLAFQFRAQGYPLRATIIGTVFSVILWGSFFLSSDRGGEPRRTTGAAAAVPPSPWESFERIWFAANAAILTLLASLFLFVPDAGLALTFPCLSHSAISVRGAPSALTLAGMGVGTHLLSVAAATWIATIYSRTNATLRRAVAGASTVHAGLLCALPLSGLALDAGRACATSSLLVYSVPLFAGWLLRDALSYRGRRAARVHLAQPAGA